MRKCLKQAEAGLAQAWRGLWARLGGQGLAKAWLGPFYGVNDDAPVQANQLYQRALTGSSEPEREGEMCLK
jgi:hypothetical protein